MNFKIKIIFLNIIIFALSTGLSNAMNPAQAIGSAKHNIKKYSEMTPQQNRDMQVALLGNVLGDALEALSKADSQIANLIDLEVLMKLSKDEIKEIRERAFLTTGAEDFNHLRKTLLASINDNINKLG